MFKKKLTLLSLVILLLLTFCACKPAANNSRTDLQKNETLKTILENQENESLTAESRFTVIYQIATSLLAEKNHTELVLFLTDHVEQNPDDLYNAYWLLMIAHSYMQQNGIPIAEYYFDRILNNYEDLLVKGQSVHYTCLTNLIEITQSIDNKISYYTQLISKFPDKINLTEIYARLAGEYEKLGEWEQMLNYYALFKSQPNATTIQISGLPNAYSQATQMLDFNTSSKDWTFETLEDLEKAVRTAIRNRNYRQLDRYKSKVNFFAMSWKQDPIEAANNQISFSLSNVMRGAIRCSDTLDETSNPTEAYLRTWGWQQNVSVWYFYFRKINFPIDPDVHGHWEWAGIYFGEKL